ncbi:hypothetical protein GMOD_00007341 [Pyrenophora seminiperda CCB06]|uniref:Uncharacterized protein n=1 Tax=Pyrenophora seminiperda CCB06 TaxID=1302712 RepID=A0A3M7MD62_9PLEO|nr:hypothetical protein GMOD_00007341 [Pyrenophora seminiperda CCB06]
MFRAHAAVVQLPPAAVTTPGCAITMFELPPVQTNCTFYQETTTQTVYTECHGCTIKRVELGLGLPCQAVTNVPGTATKTVTACAGVVTPADADYPGAA